MKILFADALHSVAVDQLTAAGHDVVVLPQLKDEALGEALAEHRPTVLVVRSTKVTASHLNAWSGLALVVRAGAGVNTIDLTAAGARGVYVANCPGKNAVAVAELTMGLLLAIDRKIPDNVAWSRRGEWNKKGFSKGRGLKGRTLGILGFGAIGRSLAKRARAFGMDVVAWSRSLTAASAAAADVGFAETPIALASQVDVVSVHCAQTAETRHLVGQELLAALPEGAIVLNTSRDGLVDEQALLAALDTKGLWAGLDVFDGEPATKTGPFDSPLRSHPRVYLTHHIGAATEQAQSSVAREAVKVILGFAGDGQVLNCVNLVQESSAQHGLAIRHQDRVGALASILEVLRAHQLNIQEMENAVFTGGEAAVARIQVHGEPNQAMIDELHALEHVLHVSSFAMTSGGTP